MDQAISNHSGLISTLFIPAVAISAAGILAACLAVIVRMTCRTNHFIRLLYTTISAGAFGEMIGILTGATPKLWEALLVVGVGLLFMFDRRNTHRANRHPDCECQREKDRIQQV